MVWDPIRGIEHFVRDARFDSPGSDLGFIAPTPTKPDIQAVKSEAFLVLDGLGPKPPGYGSSGGGEGGVPGGPGVLVVERKIVAGYEATMLQASDARAMAQWMGANGYPVPAYAARWIAPYVRKDWYLTAFKVSAEGGGGSTGPVRMSFETNRPFNPYSVPAESGGSGGLSLYCVSTGGEEAKIGGTKPWVAPQWRAPLKAETAARLASALGLEADAIPADDQVAFYRDPGFGRPGFDDVYFVPTPPPYPHWPPSTLAALAGFGAFAFVGVRPRRR